MAIDEFLARLGAKENSKWEQIAKPPKVIVILGKRGSGKTALGMYLIDIVSSTFNMLPVLVNFPAEKQSLLPTNFVIKSLEEIKSCDNSAILIDEGTTAIPAGKTKLEETIKSAMALSRQRQQVIIFIFHASSDVGSRILRGIDVLAFKEPSIRQIQWGSKDDYFRQLLLEAKEKLANRGPQFTYTDSEEPEFRGVLENPLTQFWSEDLSKAWAGVGSVEGNAYNLFSISPKPERKEEKELSTEDRLNIYGVPSELHKAVIEMDREHSLEELREMCRQKGLPTTGDKKKLAGQLIMEET